METPPIIDSYEGEYKTSEEYASALRGWLQKVQQAHALNVGLSCFLSSSLPGSSAATASAPSSAPAASPAPAQQAPPRPTTAPQRGVQYCIPSLWRRGLSELIDFTLLLALKLLVTLVTAEWFDHGGLTSTETIDQLNEHFFGEEGLEDGLPLALSLELMALQAFHVVGKTFIEGLSLQGWGGGTPGKRLCGLRVVRCEWAAQGGAGRVTVGPGTGLGLGRSMLRAFVKNVSVALMLPLWTSLFVYQHNRTGYDLLAGCIVVMDVPAAR